MNIDIILRIVSINEDIDAEVPITATAGEVIQRLLDNNIIPARDDGGMPITYRLTPKARREVIFADDEVLEDLGVREGAILLCTPIFVGGGVRWQTLGDYGKLAYDFPPVMAVGEKRQVRIRISVKALADYLLQHNLSESTKLTHVELSEVMRVKLTENAATPSLSITAFDEAAQFINRKRYTEWVFEVQPKVVGMVSLLLNVAMVKPLKRMGTITKTVFLFEHHLTVAAAAEPASPVLKFYPALQEIETWDDQKLNQVTAHLAANQTGEALSVLANHFQHNRQVQSAITLLKGQYVAGRNKERLNTIDPLIWMRVQNRINYVILELANDLRYRQAPTIMDEFTTIGEMFQNLIFERP